MLLQSTDGAYHEIRDQIPISQKSVEKFDAMFPDDVIPGVFVAFDVPGPGIHGIVVLHLLCCGHPIQRLQKMDQ